MYRSTSDVAEGELGGGDAAEAAVAAVDALVEGAAAGLPASERGLRIRGAERNRENHQQQRSLHHLSRCCVLCVCFVLASAVFVG